MRARRLLGLALVLACGATPAAFGAKGMLVVATAATHPPNEFTVPGSAVVRGMDADLTRAVAAALGLRVRFVDVKFDTILRGVAAHTYDLGVSSITATAARQKKVDFVTYFSAGTAFYVKAGGGAAITTPAGLCGRTVAVVSGTTQAADATARDAECVKAGNRGITVAEFPDDNGALVAIESSDRAVGIADSPVAAYIVKQSHGRLQLTGKTYGTAPYGIAVPKGSALAKPVLDALKKLIADGTYRAILAKWGVESGAIASPQLTPTR